MQITLKTLQQNTFKVEIEPSETVAALKKKIESDKGDAFPAEGQKLIYAGKILGTQKIRNIFYAISLRQSCGL